MPKLLVQKDNLKQRIAKARAAALFAMVLNNGTHSKTVSVPGTDAKRYNVIIRPRRNPTYLDVECLMDAPGQLQCKGDAVSVCYHEMAAVMKMAKGNGFKTSVAHSDVDATRLRRIFEGKGMDTRVIEVRSRTSHRSVWVVLRKEETDDE